MKSTVLFLQGIYSLESGIWTLLGKGVHLNTFLRTVLINTFLVLILFILKLYKFTGIINEALWV